MSTWSTVIRGDVYHMLCRIGRLGGGGGGGGVFMQILHQLVCVFDILVDIFVVILWISRFKLRRCLELFIVERLARSSRRLNPSVILVVSLELLSWRAHGWDLLRGQRLKGLSHQMWIA
jgi:hypothetical protein